MKDVALPNAKHDHPSSQASRFKVIARDGFDCQRRAAVEGDRDRAAGIRLKDVECNERRRGDCRPGLLHARRNLDEANLPLRPHEKLAIGEPVSQTGLPSVCSQFVVQNDPTTRFIVGRAAITRIGPGRIDSAF